MTSHHERKIVPYTPDQMFDLVMDVERYPEFLPWIEELTVFSRREAGDGQEVMDAEMRVRFKMIRERIKTRVYSDPAKRRVQIDYQDGPFKKLDNIWHFHPARTRDGRQGCEIDFWIDFEIRSRALQMIISTVFGEAVRRMVGAFESRAHTLYKHTSKRSEERPPA